MLRKGPSGRLSHSLVRQRLPLLSLAERADYIGGMDQPSAARRSFWRFSLRELLLLMLVIATSLGWGVTVFRPYLPLSPSPFARELFLETDIAEVRRQIGESADPSIGMMSDGSGTTGRRYQKDFVYTFALTPDNAYPFMKALQAKLRQEVVASGCREGAGGYSGSSFRIDYEYGNTEGTLRAYIDPGDERAKMFVFLHEQRQPP